MIVIHAACAGRREGGEWLGQLHRHVERLDGDGEAVAGPVVRR